MIADEIKLNLQQQVGEATSEQHGIIKRANRHVRSKVKPEEVKLLIRRYGVTQPIQKQSSSNTIDLA